MNSAPSQVFQTSSLNGCTIQFLIQFRSVALVKKAASIRRPLQSVWRHPLMRRRFHLRRIHVEVGVDILHIVQLFERVQQANHLVGRRPFELRIG